MATEEPMATATEILTLAQWFSPSFPVGGFAYSHGLEWAIECGDVACTDSARAWIETTLRHGAGWNDCILMSAAFHAKDTQELAKIDATCRALAASRERLQESDLQGSAFCTASSQIAPLEITGLSYPVAAGRAAALVGLPLDLTAQLYLQSFLSNLAAVAMRLVPLGQTQGQRAISDLNSCCIKIAQQAISADLRDLSASAFLTDIAAMRHETQYSRIFRT